MTERFWNKVDIGAPDICWEWMGYRLRLKNGKPGYGKYRYNGKQWGAHRLAYLFTHGDIPSPLCVCHSCDNPACCNPSHLWLGTIADNNHDRDRKGRGVYNGGKRENAKYARGSKHGQAKLTEQEVREIKTSNNGIKRLAREYGVSPKGIRLIKKGVNWAHVN